MLFCGLNFSSIPFYEYQYGRLGMGVGTRKRRDPTSTLGSLGHPKPKAELWGCTLLHRFPVSSSFTSLLPPPSTLAREQTTFQPTHPEHPPQGLLSLGFFALKNPLLLILSLPTKCRGPPPTNRCVWVCVVAGGWGAVIINVKELSLSSGQQEHCISSRLIL